MEALRISTVFVNGGDWGCCAKKKKKWKNCVVFDDKAPEENMSISYPTFDVLHFLKDHSTSSNVTIWHVLFWMKNYMFSWFFSSQVDGILQFQRQETRGQDEGLASYSRSLHPGMKAICACHSGTNWQATTWECSKCLWRKESSTVRQCGAGQEVTAGGTPRSRCGVQA